jgi:hypothetical protein
MGNRAVAQAGSTARRHGSRLPWPRGTHYKRRGASETVRSRRGHWAVKRRDALVASVEGAVAAVEPCAGQELLTS